MTRSLLGNKLGLLAALALLLLPLAFTQVSEEIDYDKFRQIRDKQRAGDTLTQEESSYLDHVRALRQRQIEEFRKANPPRESTGLIPLPELGKGKHKGFEGGLYPGGRNSPPEEHLKAGLKLAGRIVPLDTAGQPSADGKIVLMSVGMSNTTQEFQAFMKLAEGDAGINPRVLVVDGAQGGQAADVTASPSTRYWNVSDQRLAEAGASPLQVQVVWIKQATRQPSKPFPTEAKKLQGYLVDALRVLAERYLNLKIAYLSNRIYAGYATTPLNPEPHAYETAFAVKWLIEEQINGNPELNYDPAKGKVRAPWIAWGPYLWTDGLTPGAGGLTYSREGLADDGTHPSTSGRRKVAELLLRFFRSDPTSKPWFVRLAGRS